MRNNILTKEEQVYKLKFDVTTPTIPNLNDVVFDFNFLELIYEDDSLIWGKDKVHDYELIKTDKGFSVLIYFLNNENDSYPMNVAIDEEYEPSLETSDFSLSLGGKKYEMTWDSTIGTVLNRVAPIQVSAEENDIINDFYKVFPDTTAVNYIYNEILSNKTYFNKQLLETISAITKL